MFSEIPAPVPPKASQYDVLTTPADCFHVLSRLTPNDVVIQVVMRAEARFCNEVRRLPKLTCIKGFELTIVDDLMHSAICIAWLDGANDANYVRGDLEVAIGVPGPKGISHEAVVGILYRRDINSRLRERRNGGAMREHRLIIPSMCLESMSVS